VIHNSRIAPVTTRIVVKSSEAKRRVEADHVQPQKQQPKTRNQNHKNHVYTKPKFS